MLGVYDDTLPDTYCTGSLFVGGFACTMMYWNLLSSALPSSVSKVACVMRNG